jgi:hypothetical protein
MEPLSATFGVHLSHSGIALSHSAPIGALRAAMRCGGTGHA